MEYQFQNPKKTSHNWVARGTKIESSRSTNRNEEDNHCYDCNEKNTYSSYNSKF